MPLDNDAPNQAELLTTHDLEQIFKTNRMTLWRWRKKYGLPVVLVKGNKQDGVRYDKKAVKEWAILKGMGSLVATL